MFYLYVLKSRVDGSLYIGQTNDLRRRFKEHNDGLSPSTKYKRPYRLVYYEAYSNQKDVLRRERRLKQFKNSYMELKKRLDNSLDDA